MFVVMVSRVTRATEVARLRFGDEGALWPIARVQVPDVPRAEQPEAGHVPWIGPERQSRSPVTPVAKASRPPPGVTSPHAVIFHSFAVPPASTSSKPVDVSTL